MTNKQAVKSIKYTFEVDIGLWTLRVADIAFCFADIAMFLFLYRK